MLVRNILDFGKKRANPCACPTNVLKLEKGGCCKIQRDPSCKDTIAIPKDAKVKGITFEGKFYDFTAVHYYENGDLLVPAVGELTANSEEFRSHVGCILPAYEFNIYVRLVEDGDNVNLCHIGACKLESVTLADDSTIEASRCCELVVATKWQTQVVGATDFSFDGGVAKALDLALGADTAENDTKAAAAKTIIEGCVGTMASEVDVVYDPVFKVFTISLKTAKDAPLVGGSPMTDCGISCEFLCE